MGPFGDGALQHPLIDDDGDKSGAIIASGRTKTVYLGAGATLTNTVNPQDITAVGATAYLTATTNQIQLSLSTYGTADSAWAELRRPNTIITTGTGSGQLIIDLPRVLLTRDPIDNKKWTGTANLSNLYQTNPPAELPSGTYEIYYGASANGNISVTTRAVAYKNKTGNRAPTEPKLTTPTSGGKVKTITLFNWTASDDADGDPFTYTLTITDALGAIVHTQDEIPVTSTYIPNGILKDAHTYSWNIQAIDRYGAKTTSQSQTFSTDNTNGLPSIIMGFLRSSAGMPIANATITTISTGTSQFTTLPNGGFITMDDPGIYTVTATASGYQSKTLSNISVTPGNVLDASMSLSATTGTAAKPGDCDGNGTVTITEVQGAINMFLGLKSAEICVDIDKQNGVSISEVQKVINSFLGL
jgi:hypothetical protein